MTGPQEIGVPVLCLGRRCRFGQELGTDDGEDSLRCTARPLSDRTCPGFSPAAGRKLSCRPAVLVDEAAEDVVALDGPNKERSYAGLGELKQEAPMGASGVVVRHVSPWHAVELATGEDEQVVQALGVEALYPPLRGPVRPGRSHRRADGPDCPRCPVLRRRRR